MKFRASLLTERRHHVLAGAAVGSSLALVVAGCGGAPSHRPLTPRQAVLASVTATQSATSVSLAVAVSINGSLSLGSGSGTAISLSITGQGEYSFLHKTGKLALSVPSQGQNSDETVQIEQIGDELYAGTPALASLDGGKPWVEFNLSQFDRTAGQSDPLATLDDGDPTQILGLLKTLDSSVTKVSQGRLFSFPGTEYQTTIDPAWGSASSTISPELASTLGLTSVPVDVWVDSSGRARQVALSFSVLGLSVKAQLAMGSFGTAVSVTAPPADEVTSGSSLLQQGQLGSIFGSLLG